ncbi:conserved hypothetical protein [Leishmania major strain Friedlin]|uniref:Uncharacterized protein n=1 Tax=Leishmania major TaxID=5664 RepID=Q4Q8M5_LEIMA|nr:conserved hypothetical protein [Leishmania major strain Friedlin]CAG9577106.1 hypothetical_protein_-_conserved [Leishmania major strain Friedlin]CAJ04976.1 conserved hypothetical protein [Leishmania major strain Friedlin]|eukprot:XP_001684323.1 conserved hypothetical protein [Leishmania major strain Friedlin]
MDLNDFLRNTKTAAQDGSAGVRTLLSGHKRFADTNEASAEASSSGAGASGKRPRRSGTAEGLNIRAAQEALAQERGNTSAQAQQQRAQAELLSEQAAARMVHQVLEYVMQVELGGRHNAAKGGIAPFVPSAAQLAAEKAMWTPAAGYVIHHVVPATLDTSPHTLESLMSVTEKERVPDGVRALRGTLQVFDTERDLVGGVRTGMAPHLRTHVLEVLEKGLHGRAWLRDDAAVATQISALGKPTTPDKGPSSVLLFGDLATASVANSDATSSARDTASAGDEASKPRSKGFSLAAFLNGNDPTSSSSDGEDP